MMSHTIEHSAPYSRLKQLPVYFYLITVLIQFDCFISQFPLEKHFACFNSRLRAML